MTQFRCQPESRFNPHSLQHSQGLCQHAREGISISDHDFGQVIKSQIHILSGFAGFKLYGFKQVRIYHDQK